MKLGNWVLVDRVTGLEVNIGDLRTTAHGDCVRIVGGEYPKHGNGTTAGRVHVQPCEAGGVVAYYPEIEFYPSAIGCQWRYGGARGAREGDV